MARTVQRHSSLVVCRIGRRYIQYVKKCDQDQIEGLGPIWICLDFQKKIDIRRYQQENTHGLCGKGLEQVNT